MDKRNEQIRRITQRLRIIFKAIQAHSKTVEKECGLSSAKLWMLHEIAANPGLKVSHLAMALFIHPSTCSNMVSKLEEKDLVRRDRSRQDQRTVHLFITAKAEEILAKAPRPVQGQLSSALNKLTPAQLAGLDNGLDDLIRVLQVPQEDAGLIPIHGE